MNLFSSKKTMVNLLTGSLLLIGASATQAATFTCQSCENSFMSGSVSLDENRVWDWTTAELNFGKEGTFFKDNDISSSQSNTSNIFSFAYNGTEGWGSKLTFVIGEVKGLVGLGFIDAQWSMQGDNNGVKFDIASGVSRYTLDTPSAVPVPAAAFLFAPALMGFAALRRKKAA